ncbi:MAG: hypothetical protein Q7S58_11565 [Candidatus Binatus sp.]|uniref:hypothetical protein n=1 Tax=Candidatus Binatus sp. TaxID=2811406 RepID=UPI00271C35A7|nr:hypothetical protein [Candidatus Binatus sp.]MDO8433035.1 hypothetical protein [Candidatus Binatus sp.]
MRITGENLRRGARIITALSRCCAILGLLLLATPPVSSADDMQATASQLSDNAFRLLNSINTGAGKAGPILAPVASLAGDAQTLSAALTANDRDEASRAMTSILSDRAQINSLTASGSNGMNLAEWNALKSQISELEKNIPAAKVAPASVTSRAATLSSIAPPSAERLPAAPKIQIASRVFKEGAVRVKGFLQGTDLKSAGIYDGEQKSRDIDVASTRGEQRVNFDFTIRSPSPAESIRVSDSYGREAHATVAPDASMAAATHGREELIEVEPGAGSGGRTIEGPIASSGPAPRNNTAEIPRPGDADSPSRRRMGAGPSLGGLTDVQINVIDAEEVMGAPGNVEVVGQIAGRGVKRAGVYVNGRLAKAIPLSAGGFSGFDVTFPMPPRSDAKIRAYGNGADFVEASIDTTGNSEGGLNTYNNTPMYAPPGYPAYPGAPYGRPNPYAYGSNPYAYGANPYAPNPYPNGYGPPPPYGAPPGYGYPPQPAPKTPWWSKILH